MKVEGQERLLVVGAAAAMLLLVVIALVISFPEPAGIGCSSITCRPSFIAGNPSAATLCTGASAPTVGCLAATDYFYTLSIETSTFTFGEVLFKVVQPEGSVYAATTHGAFAILNASGHIVAAFNLTAGGPLAMSVSAGWSYFTSSTGVSSSSSLDSLYTIVIDMGSVNPTSQGYTFVAVGTGGYSGMTTPLALP
jgi:hypothetical protein